MPSAFKTQPGDPALEIAAVGLCEADGQGGVPLDRAAECMPVLQDKNGKPLTGKALTDAAKTWADSVGLTVGNVTDVTDTPAQDPTTTPAAEPEGQEK